MVIYIGFYSYYLYRLCIGICYKYYLIKTYDRNYNISDITSESGGSLVMFEKEFWKPGNMLYPIPAVMVSCGSVEKPNIITIAWTGTICTNPAMVSISIRKERYSYELIKDNKEFVINLVTRDLLKEADYCGVKSGRDEDKFKEMKLTALKGNSVSVPLIGESPVNIECVVKDILPLGSHDLFLAEVVSVAVDKKFMDAKGRFDLNKSGLVVFSHGEYYALGELLGKFGYSVKKK